MAAYILLANGDKLPAAAWTDGADDLLAEMYAVAEPEVGASATFDSAADTIDLDVRGMSSAVFTIRGTYGACLLVVTGDPGDGQFYGLNAQGASTGTVSALPSLSANQTQMYFVNVAGIETLRVSAFTWASGSASVVAFASAGPLGSANYIAALADTELPAAAALSDATSNPTAPMVGSAGMLWDPAASQWVRERVNHRGTTGDSGAKTATGNGATQTNHDSRGAYIAAIVTPVSGTTPTAAFKLQWSPDGGTTWLDFGPAASNLTAAGQVVFAVYPTNVSQAAGATPADLALGATQMVRINAPLPRTWRLVWTIGGTTPSFTITSVQVNHQR